MSVVGDEQIEQEMLESWADDNGSYYGRSDDCALLFAAVCGPCSPCVSIGGTGTAAIAPFVRRLLRVVFAVRVPLWIVR